jgi:hypothetical protein
MVSTLITSKKKLVAKFALSQNSKLVPLYPTGRASTAMGAVLALRPENATRLSEPDVSVPAVGTPYKFANPF